MVICNKFLDNFWYNQDTLLATVSNLNKVAFELL